MDSKSERRYKMLWVTVLVLLISVGSRPAFAAEQPDGTPTLEEITIMDMATAARIALAGNPSLAAAQARVRQANEAVRQARAAYWPQLDLSATASRAALSDTNLRAQRALVPFTGVSVEDPQEYYTAGITASWLLFNGFSRKFDLAAAKYGAQTSESARFDTQRLLLSAVTGAFLSAQLALENVAIAKADDAFNQRQLTEARLRYDVGTGALSDVLNFEVKANAAQSDRIEAEQLYQTSRIALAALLGVPQAQLPADLPLAPLKAVADNELVAPEETSLLQTALDRRPDLALSDSNAQQAQAEAKSARGRFFPTLSLSASHEGERTGDSGFESDDFGNTVAIGLSYPLFAGGLNHARHQQAKARLAELEKTKTDTEINITSEVRIAASRVGSAQKQLILQRSTARLVKRNRDLVEKEYKAGVGSLVRLNEAQRDLTAAQVSLAAARVALRQAWYDLQTATGEILTAFK